MYIHVCVFEYITLSYRITHRDGSYQNVIYICLCIKLNPSPTLWYICDTFILISCHAHIFISRLVSYWPIYKRDKNQEQ